ncbi:MAG TPA: hypothetical protein VG456_13850 [Candidatus Sulfopaludibacter sp.]|jgi:hypothetical protein|nr:hypothetical protein [Candidatus Sulfopaludibacter sp.]
MAEHFFVAFAMVVGCAFVVGLILLFRYIYLDAKRRNMNAALWTVLAIIAPSGIGIILYFLLRQPLPVCCTKCGGAVVPGFVYCPYCGAALALLKT